MTKPIQVNLPDGSIVLVRKIGKVHLCDELVLHTVLFAKEFTHNLISVGRLADQFGIMVKFSLNKCFFYTHDNARVLAIGRRNGGLYFLQTSSSPHTGTTDIAGTVATVDGSIDAHHVSHSACSTAKSGFGLHTSSAEVYKSHSVSTSNTFNLSHARLGHVSLSKMKHMDIFNCHGITKYHCDACILAKCHKLPFPKSSSRASVPFELVHVDLWGPYRVKTLNGHHIFLQLWMIIQELLGLF